MAERNVADGTYQVKVEASDEAANPTGEGKTDSRVSEDVVVDNTPPVIGDLKSSVDGADAKVALKVVDRASIVAAPRTAWIRALTGMRFFLRIALPIRRKSRMTSRSRGSRRCARRSCCAATRTAIRHTSGST